ncbi:MAG: 50S ribosomal protein L21 [Gemmataceae bacterium]|nr:50S ribosomal protein L21 [Gemmataceae bacterium]
MYAVIVDGSRQYRVKEGDLIRIDYREGEPGQLVEFGRVLLIKGDGAAVVGQPTIEGAKVVGEVEEQTSEKYLIQRFRRRKNYRRLKGHRQPYSLVRIQQIVSAGAAPANS